MEFRLPIVYLLCISQNVLGHRIKQDLTPYDDDLSYQDIIAVNGSCFPRDSCEQSRTEDPIFPLEEYRCNCNARCWEFGTCCIDSPYRAKTPIQKCVDTNNPFDMSGNYMVYRCPDSTNSDSVWKNLCEQEWSGEDDILMLSPVSSLETSLTYKNYYCFRCHEATDKYISWNLLMQSSYDISGEKSGYSLTYSQAESSWMAAVDDNRIPVPVSVSFEFPYFVDFSPTGCDLHLISNCPDTWTDKSVHDKCLAYTAVIYRGLSSYKNVHCALCNNVSLDDLSCLQTTFPGIDARKKIISFRHLLDLNFAGDKVGNDGKCDNEHLWDPYGKKCRKISCAVPGHVIKGTSCAPP